MTEQTHVSQLRAIFISHGLRDRALADALNELATKGFMGTASVYQSSARGAGKGLEPGRLWFGDLDRELGAAFELWVLATPYSVQRPWVLYEAGHAAGRGANIIPILVDLTENDLPEPLRQRQAVNGNDVAAMRDMIEKVGGRMGLQVPAELSQPLAERWVSEATAYSGPEVSPVDSDGDLTIEPEQLSRIEAAITRLESVANAADRGLPKGTFGEQYWKQLFEDTTPVRESPRRAVRLSDYVSTGRGIPPDPALMNAIELRTRRASAENPGAEQEPPATE